MFEMIEFYETAVKISMSSVKGIGMRGWQAASKMIRKVTAVRRVDSLRLQRQFPYHFSCKMSSCISYRGGEEKKEIKTIAGGTEAEF